jgi:hypothetical protein
MRIVPLTATSKPAIRLRIVVLPEPDGPMSAVSSLAATARSNVMSMSS